MLISEKQAYLAALIFSSVLAWASFLSIIFFVSPQNAGILGIAILYISAVTGLAGFFIILWQLLNRKKN